MVQALAVLLSLAFFAWLIWMAARRRPIKAHMVMYALAWLTGMFTIGFFLSMNIPTMVKVLASIVLGAVLIYIAAKFQSRQMPGQG